MKKSDLFNNGTTVAVAKEDSQIDLDKRDVRNKLNDLSNKEWMILSKSIWVSRPGPRDYLKSKHPATFAESDISRLLQFFTKKNHRVLDPFLGVGSTLISCRDNGRSGYGIELIPKWAEIARHRLNQSQMRLEFAQNGESESLLKQTILSGDSKDVLKKFEDNYFQFIVTSPPYWKILQKDKDHKAKRERVSKGLDTKYSELKADLGNTKNYKSFLCKLQIIFKECFRILENKKYMAVIVTDFKHKSRYYSFHADLTESISDIGFTHEGIIILVQDNKNLYPYGIPYAYVPNINHQYILIFRKKI